METKMRLISLGKKQADLIVPLAEHGVNANQTEVCAAINGRGTHATHKKILEAVNEILTEWEEKK